MQPTQVKQPFPQAWLVYEDKIDGYRMLAYKDGRTIRLESRNGVDHTRRFPEPRPAPWPRCQGGRWCSMVR